jgi:histidinol-phosphate/aromatic aminotransferase/cobyric acid decarboxylase-like protein
MPEPVLLDIRHAAEVLNRYYEEQNKELLAALKNLAAAYRARVPSILSTDLCWATLLEAEELIREIERGER